MNSRKIERADTGATEVFTADGTSSDETWTTVRVGMAGAAFSAACWIRQSSRVDGCECDFLHFPGAQQLFFAADADMKYCEHDKQPPHSSVAERSRAKARLVRRRIALRAVASKVMEIGGASLYRRFSC